MNPLDFNVWSFLPVTIAIVLSGFGLFIGHFILIKGKKAANIGSPLMRQLSMLALVLAAVLIVILCLPLGDSTRGQVLSFLGIVVTAAIALSSTTFLGNVMAGLMIKAVKGVRAGDFIRIGEHFGRVSELGLLHSEIQNEDRDLTTLPNLYLVTNPVKVVRSSGTIISANISLGYDIPYANVIEALERAAENADLEEPFVQIMELGDYSIVYRVAGFLKEVKTMISARSRLRVCALHALHEQGIEIVSPSFMNQRVLPLDQKMIPTKIEQVALDGEESPEKLIFDKADQAESIDKLKDRLKEVLKEISALEEKIQNTESSEEQESFSKELKRLKKRQEYFQKLLETKKESATDPK